MIAAVTPSQDAFSALQPDGSVFLVSKPSLMRRAPNWTFFQGGLGRDSDSFR